MAVEQLADTIAGFALFADLTTPQREHVVDVFGPNPHVVAMTITNEVNVTFSPNTSDGAYTGAGTVGWVYIGLVALIFGLVNTYIKPIVTLVSLPLNLFALGLVGFIVNAAMLLLTTWVVGLLHSHPYILKLGEFPPNLGLNAIIAAVIGSIVISIVSTVLTLVFPD